MQAIRNTKTKRSIEKSLSSVTKPLTLRQLHEAIKKEMPQTAFSTVYRIVHNLEANEKVTRIDWRERGSYYEWSGHPHHHHIVCESCNSFEDISDELLHYNEDHLARNTGYQIKHHSIELVGVCQPCQQEGKS